jgi:serine protease Do
MSALLLALASQLNSVQPPDQEAYLRRFTPTVQVVQAARPAVVYIQTNVPPVVGWNIFGQAVRQNVNSSGSGVVIYEEGYIVTNYHVVRGASDIRVQFDTAMDETAYPAKLINWTEEEDLALLKIDRAEPFPTVPMGTSADLLIGEDAIAIGNPYGQTLSVSRGIISGLHRNVQASGLSFQNLIQTDASINPGNSGGPLLNVNGELIGINTVMNTAAENIGFAIPVDRVREVLKEHLLEPSKARAWLGFEVDLDRMAVSEVTPGGPADEQGMHVGDRVVALDGKPLATAEDYRLARIAIHPGQEAAVRVRRGALDRTYKLSAWDRSDVVTYLRAGMIVEPVVLQTSRAVRVRSVRPNGPAAEVGLRPDDVIKMVAPAGRRAQLVGSGDELAVLLALLEPGTEMRIDVLRDEDGNGRFELTGGRSEFYRGELKIQ